MSVSCEQVRVVYGSGEGATVALDAITLEVNPGESLALTGPSGSGKSTLIRVLAGLQTPDAGSVRIGQHLLTAKNSLRMRRREIGLVFQDYRLVPFLTAEENVVLASEVSRQPKPTAAVLDEIFMSLGLSALRTRACHTLSGGEQQRVAIARALAGAPSVILADEPTGALDGANSAEVANLLAGLAANYGAAVVVATHDHVVASGLDRELVVDRFLARTAI